MIEIMRIATVTVLGFICAWLAKRWLENFDDKLMGALLAFGILCLIGYIVDLRNDLREERERRSNAESQLHSTERES
jgi:hypothetical protein